MYEAIIEPSLLYGCGSWPSQEKYLSKINAVQMRVLSKIGGKTRRDRIRNARIRANLNQNAVTQKIEQTQLKWYGHVKRMKESRIPRQILEARTEGKRPRGRQRTTYMDVIEKLVGKKRKEHR